MATVKDDIDRLLASPQQPRGGLTPAGFGTPSGSGRSAGGSTPNAFGGQQLTGPGAKDYLGQSTDIKLGGSQDVTTSGAGSLPAASGVGGQSGFMGGGGPGRISAPGGAMPGMPDVSGFIRGAVNRIMQGGPDTRGNVGGEGQLQQSDQSLSDRLRSGADYPDFNSWLSGLALNQGGNITLDIGPSSPMSQLDVLRENLPGVDFSSGASGGTGVPGSASAVGGGAGTLGSLAGMAVGPLLSYLGSLATKDASPEMQAAISGLTQALAPVAAPAAAGAVSGLASGAGALSGAAGGLAAAGPGLIAGAPMAALIIATSINKMIQDQQNAALLGKRAQGLMSSIPGHMAAVNKAPELLAQLNQATTPEQAAAIYQQLNDIQTAFDQTGMEDFLQHGRTALAGGNRAADLTSLSFEQGPEIFKSLQPQLQALNLGRLRAADIAARGGAPIEGALGPADFAMALGGPEFSEALRPGSSTGWMSLLGQSLQTPGGSPEALRYAGSGQGQPGDLAPLDVIRYAGLPDDRLGTVTMGDIANYMGAGGAGKARADQFQQTGAGLANQALLKQIQALQPGGYEQGLAGLFSQYGGAAPGLEAYGFGNLPASPEQTQLAQRALDGLAGGGGGMAAPGVFGPGGALPEDERRRLGLR